MSDEEKELEAEKKKTEELKKQKAEKESLIALGKKELERLEKEKRLRAETIKDLERELQLNQAFGDVRDAAISKQNLLVELLKQAQEQEKEKLDNLEQGKEFDDAKREHLEETLKSLQKQGFYIEATLDDFKDITTELKEQEKVQDKQEKWAGKYESLIGGIASKLGLGNSALTKTIKQWTKVAQEVGESSEAAEEFAKQIQQTFSVANVLGSLIESFVGMAMQVDNTSAKLAASTGAGDKFRDSLANIRAEGFSMGRSLENISESLEAFNSNLIGFNSISQDSLESLATMGADFKRLGISGEDFTKTLNIMTKSMGVSNKTAGNLAKELSMVGTNMGISSQKIMRDFTAASSVLAVHGNKSIKVFKNLAAAARNTGVEMSELLGIAAKFDTFSDAAETTGKLNAILGSQLSATKLLMMNEDERVESIIRTVQAQGIAFNQMDRFTQKAIAGAAGITDMAKANQIFGMSLNQYRRSQAEMQRQEDVQKKFADAVKATIPLQEKFANALQSITANKSFIKFLTQAIDFLEGFLTGLAKFNEATGGAVGYILLFSVAIAGLGGMLAPLISLIGGLGAAIFTAGQAADKTSNKSITMAQKFSIGLKTIATAALKSAGGIGVIVLAMIGIAYAFQVAALGAAELVKAFGGLGDAGMAAAGGLVGFTIALAGMFYALSLISSGSAFIAPALIVLGVLAGAFFLIGNAVEKITNSIKEMSGELVGAITTMGKALSNTALIADIIANASSKLQSLGTQQKLELKSTLQSMAVITSGGRYIPQQAAAAGAGGIQDISFTAPTVNNEIKLGNIKLVVEDNKSFRAYIASVNQS